MIGSVNYIQSKYGSYKGLLKHIKTQVALRSGVYSQLLAVEWGRVERLVFVCKGNVCRSPYAAQKAADLGIPTISFGLDTGGDTPANSAASRCALERGVDLVRHRSAHIRTADFKTNELLLFFEPGHIFAAKKILDHIPAQISLVGLWSSPKRPYIFDPYGRSDECFRYCFDAIDSSIANISARLRCS